MHWGGEGVAEPTTSVGAITLLSGGTLDLAFEVGMGVATVFGAARAQRYEEQITRVPIEQSYIVNGVDFDGYDGFALIDAKDPGYAFRIKSGWSDEPYTTPERYSETKGKMIKEKKGLIDIGTEQVEAVRATGTDTPIQWHIAEEYTFDILREKQYLGEFPVEIALIHTPPY